MRLRLLPAFLAIACAAPVAAQEFLADLTDVDGVEDNFISGVGIVAGLDGTGDGDGAVRQMAANLLRRRNINVSPEDLSADNMAVVEVQAVIRPFMKLGDHLDVSVFSMGGKAKSLYGGRLIAMELTGPDPAVPYAVAQGAVVSGVVASGASGSREKINHPTAGRITDGAKLIREVPQRMITKDGVVRLKLRRSSYATTANVAAAVDARFKGAARAVDGQTIEIKVPSARRSDPVGFLAEIGKIQVAVELPAQVVIDANTGTITVSGNVTLLPGAIAHGSLSVSIQEATAVSQPGPLSNGTTSATPQSAVRIESRGTEIRALPAATSAADVAKALNALGLTPRDLIAVFQSLKENGLLSAKLVIQ